MGGGDRLAVRLREHGHRRHRERQGPLAAAGELRALHPDRRRDQPGQLGRAAVQHARRGGRHQLADLQPHRRLHGPVVRHPDRRRARHPEAAAREGPRDARPHRRRDPGGDARPRHLVRPRPAARRAGELGGEGQPGGQGRRRGDRHHPHVRRQAGRELERPAAHRRLDPARLAVDARGVAQGQDAQAQHHGRRAAGRPRRAREHAAGAASRRPRRRRTASASWWASSPPSRRRTSA